MKYQKHLIYLAVAITASFIAWLLASEASDSRALSVMQTIHKGEQIFAGSGYRDMDADGSGEYALLSEMIPRAGKGEFSILREFVIDDEEGYYRSGFWRYTVYIPTPSGSEVFNLRAQDKKDNPDGSGLQELEYFIVAKHIYFRTCLISDCTGHVRFSTGDIKGEILKIMKTEWESRDRGSIEQMLKSPFDPLPPVIINLKQ